MNENRVGHWRYMLMSEKVEVHFRTNMQMSGADAEANECRARFGSQLYMQLN